MKLHLPILLRRAVLAVMAVLATSPAMAANTHVYTDTTYTLTDQVLNSDYDAVDGTSKPGYYDRTGSRNNYTYYHHSHLEMKGTDTSNKIVSGDGSITGFWAIKIADLPGFILGNTNPNVDVTGNVTMTTTTGYNAIVGSVTGPYRYDIVIGQVNANGGRPNVTAGGDVVMNGPANAVMLGSTINGTNITLENTDNQTTTIGKVLDGILGSYGTSFIPENNSMRKIEGIFNIVQGSKLNATGSVTLNTATDTSVNKLKVNVITGGQGDISAVAQQVLTSMGETVANVAGSIVDSIVEKAKENDSGSFISAKKDINLLGGASVIVDTTLSDLVAFSKDQTNLNTLLAGNADNSTPVTLKAGQNLNLDSIINMAYGAQGGVNLSAGTAAQDGVELSADTAEDVVGAINATGAFNIIGGKTTLEADVINLDPNKAVSVNQLIGELGQLGDLLPIKKETLTGITDKLGDFANQKISANIIAGGSQLTAEQNITTDGTLGLLLNTEVADLVDALDTLQAGNEMLFAKEVLSSGTATKVEATNGNIMLGSQINLVHGGNLADKNAVLTIAANNGTVKLQGTGNVVSGNVQVNAKGISMMGERLPADMAALGGMVGDLAGRFTDSIPGVDGMLDKLVQKGSVNVVTGGATLTAGADGIIMSDIPVDAVGKTNVINAVLDTQFTDVITAVINGEPSAILPTDKTDVIKATTTLSSGGNIDMLGRVNVVAGLRGNVKVGATGDVNMQGNLSMVAGNAVVTADSISINTSTEEKYKMYLDSTELGGLTGETKAADNSAESPLASIGVNGAIIAGGANLTATGEDGIEIGGTAGIYVNTPVADVVKALMGMKDGADVPEIAEKLLNAGTATSLTADKGNIKLGSQLNLVHGGGFTEDGANALTFTAANGAVNMEGTANVVSGNVEVDAKGISMMGERLPADMAEAAGGVVGSVTEMLPAGAKDLAGGMLDKLVQKGSVNLVTGGATLTAGANGITMSDIPVDTVGATGAINAVLDTDLAGVLGAMTGDNMMDSVKAALMAGGSHQTTLTSGGNIDMLGRVNVVNGGKVVLDAEGDVNLQGSASLISGGAKVDASNININTDEAKKYKMYFDSTELGGLVSENSPFAPIVDSISGIGVNAGIVTGGAELTADQNITMGGTLGLVMNTPLSDVMTEFMDYLDHKQETWMVYQLLQKGTATTVTSTNGNIELGAQFNLAHGGNFAADGSTALKLSAANGAVNINGTLNVVSGNTMVDAKTINMTGERLPQDMAGVANDVIGSIAGDLVGNNSGISGMLNKLVTKGNANMVVGGATLTASQGITMNGVANAVFDTEIVDLVEAFMKRNTGSLEEGSNKLTTLHTTTGNIDLLGRLNMVNGSYVLLQADAGDVNLQGNMSLVSGGAKVNATNININTDESSKYKIYIDSTDLGGLVSENSPFAPIVDSISGIGVNAGIVAGGAKLTADQNITIGGTLGLVMNTPMSDVMTEFTSYMDHQQETWMVYQLLQKGTATTVTSTNGDIEVGAQFNLLHGGGFTANAGENALVLSAANGAVNVEGTFNVISGNTQVTAQEINMTGEILPADMKEVADGVVDSVADHFIGELPAAADNLLDRLVAKGNANMVTGGATLTATGENGITMSGAANAVIDTELTDVFEAFMERSTKPLEEGGNKLTTLHTTTGNINMLGRLNVVNGSYVLLQADAGNVNLKGTLNMVSGGAKVHGNNINLVGQDNLGLNWDSLLPGDVGNYMDQMGVTDKLNKGVNGNLVLGGAMIEAKNDISISGMASVVTNVPLGSAFEALTTLRDNSWYPELWLAKDVLDDGIATTLTADGNIEMDSRLNVLHGGNIGNADAALKLTAGKEVNIAGTANIISGNTQVTAGEGIKITGKNSVGFDWNQIAKALPDKYAGYGELAAQMGILDKLSKGVNGSVIAGGATLTAESGDITMEGMATAVVDVTAENVLTAVETMNGTPIMEGGAEDTTITAKEGNINLNSRLNLVNGGQVTVDAGQNVNMGGTFNVVSGNATVKAGTNIELNAKNKVGVDISPMLNGHYAEQAEKMGMTEVLKDGVSSNIVAGGANLKAEGDVVMSGVATAIVDTTASNVIGAVKGNDLGELMTGGRSTTEVTAGNDIKLESQMNVVNGGNSTNAGGVVLNAGNDVIMGGDINVVNRAKVNAGNNVDFGGNLNVLKNATVAAQNGAVSFNNTRAEMTNGSISAGAGIFVYNSELVNTESSDVSIDSVVNITNSATLANLGSLSLNDAIVMDSTVYIDSANTVVSGALTMQSATLVFTSDTLTLNDTGIDLSLAGDALNVKDVPTVFNDSAVADAVAGVNFIISSDLLDDSMGGDFELILFENATQNDYDKMLAAIQVDEISITLSDLNRDALLSDDIAVEYVNNNIVIKGSAFVPEPSTATLSLLALAALAARRRRASR